MLQLFHIFLYEKIIIKKSLNILTAEKWFNKKDKKDWTGIVALGGQFVKHTNQNLKIKVKCEYIVCDTYYFFVYHVKILSVMFF